MKELIRAKVVTLPLEEIVYGQEVLMTPFNNDKRLIIKQYLRKDNLFLMSDGNKYQRNSFIPLAKFAVKVDVLGKMTVLGRLQFKKQTEYDNGTIIHGTVTSVPTKIRLNDTVLVNDTVYCKGYDMSSNFGLVTNVRVTSIPGAVEILLPDGDELIVSKKMLTVLGRPSTMNIFNVIKVGDGEN